MYGNSKSSSRFNAGMLRHLITIEAPAYTQDEYGAAIVAWSTAFTLLALVDPIEGSEIEYANSFEGIASHVVVIRYSSEISPSPAHRVNFDGLILSINSILNVDESNQWLVLACVQDVADTPS